MPKIRHLSQSRAQLRKRMAFDSRGRITIDESRPCVASDHCPNEIIPDCPVRLCGAHLREVYGFAADMVSDRWDEAVRCYVSELHDTFKPPKAVKQPRLGWVYFVRFGDRVKVGYTTNPDQRLVAVPNDEVIGLIPGTRDDEAAWHELLADRHVTGEWFNADAELLATLANVVSRCNWPSNR
jgi:hypothetical protein